MVRTVNVYIKAIMFIQDHPACHPYTVFVAGLTPLYRTALLKAMPTTIPMLGYSAEADLEACKHTLSALAIMSHDHADIVRRRVYQNLVSKVFGDDHEERKYFTDAPMPTYIVAILTTEKYASLRAFLRIQSCIPIRPLRLTAGLQAMIWESSQIRWSTMNTISNISRLTTICEILSTKHSHRRSTGKWVAIIRRRTGSKHATMRIAILLQRQKLLKRT
jgi:hypothetical protein